MTGAATFASVATSGAVSAITLQAQWTADAASVSHDGNGGSGTTADTCGVTDQKVKTAANGFTRTRYTFAGWSMKSDGSGDRCTENVDVTLAPGSSTLYTG